MKAFKFLFTRFSAFLFDMVVLSFISSVIMIVVVDVLRMETGVVDILYKLSQNDGIFKTLLYLAVIGLYYGLHVFFRRSTFGLWITHHQFGERMPSISQKESEDADMVAHIVKNHNKGIFKRISNAFLYSSFQMFNVASCGLLTIYAAFKDPQVAYHESVSGVRIISRKKHK